MWRLDELKKTRVYQEAQEEVFEKTIPLLLQSGMTVEQIVVQTGYSVETIQQFVPKN